MAYTTMANTYFVQKRMLYARDLRIAGSDNIEYWSWLPLRYETTSETLIEAAILEANCWLAIEGKFDTRELTPETMYEVVYVVKLEDTAYGWETPVNLKLILPNSSARPQERSVSLKEHIGKWWVDIPAGEFMTSPENTGEIHFSMHETEFGWWKKGLFVKGVAIRPKINDDFSVPELTITMKEAPNEEAAEVSVMNELYWLNNMTKNLQLNRPNGNVFMINARDLSIEWSENPDHWTWLPLPNQNPNESAVETAFLKKASWLDVAGKFDTRYLLPRTRYEVVFVVKLDYTTFEWERPVKLKLVLPTSKENPQERSVDMVDYMSNQWVDILVGEFTTSRKNIGEVSFAMYEHECQMWKSGLFIKGVEIRPKH